MIICVEEPIRQPFLSTFGNSLGASSGIVRRNKKGKQAPAPPKRTSSFRDSQCDLDPDSQSYTGDEDAHYSRRRENSSFDKLGELSDADLSGADADEDSEGSDTAQSVPDMRMMKDGRERPSVKLKGSKSRTYPKDHLSNTRLGVHNSSHSNKRQVIIHFHI